MTRTDSCQDSNLWYSAHQGPRPRMNDRPKSERYTPTGKKLYPGCPTGGPSCKTGAPGFHSGLRTATAEIPLDQLDTATVREWRVGQLEAGVPSTMVAKSYRLLRAILNTAVTEDELIIANRCRIKARARNVPPNGRC